VPSAERQPVLADAVLDECFTRDGFVTFPLLSTEEAAELRAAYRDAVPSGGEGMLVEYTQEDRRRMAAVERLLLPVWERRLQHLFADHRLVFATFVVKYPGAGSSMFLHDDRTYVDERRHRAATLWIPLVDTSPERSNGNLQIVPGSQRLALTMSGSHTPELFRPYERRLREALVDVRVRAGEGLLYDTRVLHASPPNRTDEPREAIACAIAPRAAELIHVVGTGVRTRRVHRVDESFFVEHGPAEIERRMPPRYPVVEEYEDLVAAVPPELVAEVAAAGSAPPAADLLVPADLLDLLEGRATLPASDVPTRIGSLTIAPHAERLPGGAPPADLGAEPEEAAWVPASLVPEACASWAVGNPQLAAIGDGDDPTSVVVLRLDPGDRLGVPTARWGTKVAVTRSAPPLGAGVTTVGRSAPLEPGGAVALEGPGPHVVWNHGPGRLEVVVAAPPPPTRRARLVGRVSGVRNRRRSERARIEAVAARSA
jgi:hypothetical protein